MADSPQQSASLPRLAGHALGALAGVASLVGGGAALMSDLPGVLGVTMLVIGLLLPVLAYRSMMNSRAAWSFLVSVLSVLAIVTFFGAPKVRKVLDTNLGVALVIPVLLVIAIVALSQSRGEYRAQ